MLFVYFVEFLSDFIVIYAGFQFNIHDNKCSKHFKNVNNGKVDRFYNFFSYGRVKLMKILIYMVMNYYPVFNITDV